VFWIASGVLAVMAAAQVPAWDWWAWLLIGFGLAAWNVYNEYY
tara:strand:+ start:5006 stop:5134 length:129 start_codon:yes stop_codon:yes gene_type:complete